MRTNPKFKLDSFDYFRQAMRIVEMEKALNQGKTCADVCIKSNECDAHNGHCTGYHYNW